MAAGIAGVLGDDLQKSVIDSKVLVVGAGGIGCEILKNLVLTGFKDIEIIDLDTIDVSNLNRQFLFHKQHVGKSKAHVARESALKFNPNVNIRAYHDSIISKEYGLNFFKRFSVVLNALDNLAARNHVNRMCLSSGVPLVESGTAGYEGQVELIVKGRTKCYECYPKAPQKSFPGCTIRNTPSEPIHCIVWAKHLFNQLFGEEDSDQEVSPDTEDPEAAGGAGDRALETEANKEGNVKRVSTRGWAHSCDYDPQKLFAKLFHDDIEYLLSMHDLWKNRQKPTPLSWTDILDSDASSSKSKSNDSNKTVQAGLKDQRTWSIKECMDFFANSCKSLSVQLKEKQKLSPDDHLVWDKDDKDAMEFVAACANIRAHIFKIQQKSLFEIKSMAGNIIPAIATTNAIVAGLVVLFVMNVLRNKLESCPCVYVRGKPNHRNQQVVPEKFLNPPNTKCYVCSAKPEVSVGVNVQTMTVLEFVEQVLKKSLNMVEPDVTMVRTGSIIISSDEEEFEENASKTLAECGVDDGCILEVDDFVQDYKLTVNITNRVAPREGPEFVVTGDPEQLKPNASKDNGVTESEADDKDSNGAACDENDEDSDDDIIMTFGDQEVVVASDRSLKKRKAPEGSMPVKKRKTDPDVVSNNENEDEDIMIVE